MNATVCIFSFVGNRNGDGNQVYMQQLLSQQTQDIAPMWC